MRRDQGATNCMVLSGGRGWGLAAETEMEGRRKKGTGKRTRHRFSSWTLWDSNDGVWEVCGWGCGAVPSPPHVPTPQLPLCSLSHLHTRSWEICMLALQMGGDGQAGPLRRACPTGWSRVICVFGCMRVWVRSGIVCMWEFNAFPFPLSMLEYNALTP